MFEKFKNLVFWSFQVLFTEEVGFSFPLVSVESRLILVRLEPFIVDHVTVDLSIIIVGVKIAITELTSIESVLILWTEVNTAAVCDRVDIDLLKQELIVEVFGLVLHV